MVEGIINLIYPQTCSICGKINTKPLCNKCNNKLKKEYCFKTDYYTENKNFIEHSYFFRYKDIIREQILALKFKEKPYVYETIAYFLKKSKKSFENLKKYDIIIIVPISKQRYKERGYNQSQLIAKKISQILKIPINNKILYKNKNTVQQSTLNREQRIQNAAGVYQAINCQKIVDKKILLIDDIYTTGSTVDECAKELVNNGITREQIGVLTIAKD